MTVFRTESRARLTAVLAGLLAVAGCRAPAVEAPPVVVIATPATAAPETPAPPEPEEPPVVVRRAAERLQGVWEDMETLSHHTIEEQGGRFTVISIVNPDGEPFEIRSVEWRDGVLAWSYYVPSTGYTVNLRTTKVDGDTLWCEWSNATDSGEQEFRRVKRGRK
jgi:hypothetical protein